jgi:hypothetical protein
MEEIPGWGMTMEGIAGCECGCEVAVRDAGEWGAWRGRLVERRRGAWAWAPWQRGGKAGRSRGITRAPTLLT